MHWRRLMRSRLRLERGRGEDIQLQQEARTVAG